MHNFKLSPVFLEQYKDQQPPFGPLGYVTYKRTYARVKKDGTTEEFWETCQRVVEGVYTYQKRHCRGLKLPWDNEKSQRSAQEMFKRMWEFKWLPPGRGLWMMGTDHIDQTGAAALNSCGFVSTKGITEDFADPFAWMMNMLMFGVGIGFDTKGAGLITIQEPRINHEEVYTVPDSREGWVEALARNLTPYSGKSAIPGKMDYSKIRPAGAPIKGFGGTASGSGPLEDLIGSCRKILDALVGKEITSEAIVDICNLIGRCVVAGNVRRSAEIAFGDPNDQSFLELKDPDKNPEALRSHRWSSNNSIFATVGMDYSHVAELTAKNGEPGYEWLGNAQAYSRMGHEPDYKDKLAAGGNPCFTGDTKIALADGRGTATLKELADEGKDVAVYSLNLDTNQIEVKWGRAPRLTQKDADLVRVHLESGGHVDCTPNHKWILKDGTWKEAQDLEPGDSLSKFKKKLAHVKKGGHDYWQVRVGGKDTPHKQTFEHRLIADFFDPGTRDSLYDENKQNGWIKGGIVVHHKDYDPQNNRPENLEWMTFGDHRTLHGTVDMQGTANPMYGRTHTEETKRLIGDKTLERCADPDFREKLSESHGEEERAATAERMSEQRKEWNKQYWLEQEATTDLDTVWVGEVMLVRKDCGTCGESFTMPWSKRGRQYCSAECSQQYLAGLEKRKNNQRQYFHDKQQATRHDQIMVYKDLEAKIGQPPLMAEWKAECKARGVPRRLKTPSWKTSNPYVFAGFQDLKNAAQDYNDRVVQVEVLPYKQDVFCLTVDDNGTLVVVPTGESNNGIRDLNGINLFNCLEQTLFDRELCTLVETFPSRHESYEDYKKTLKCAYLYAKSITLVSTHDFRTNAVMMRNRRIGCSMSGITEAMTKHGRREFFTWCDRGYNYIEELDDIYSGWLCVPHSIKKTSVKPSGTVSLLPGVTPGIHYPHSEYYIRRIRFQAGHPIVNALKACNYPVEVDSYSPNTEVVEFPVKTDAFDRDKSEVSMWEQLENAAQMQQYWTDNQVSITVTFKPEEASQIKYALEMYETRLKGVSFLPILDHGYVQAPYETISKEDYEARVKVLDTANVPVLIRAMSDIHDTTEKFCTNDTCVVDFTEE